MDDSQRLLKFITQLTKEYFLVRAGLKEFSQAAQITESFRDVFERDKVLTEREIFLASSGIDRRRAQHRLLERGSNYLSWGTRHLSDEIDNWTINEFVELRGQKIPCLAVVALIRNSPDRDWRTALGNAYLEKMSAIVPKLNQKWETHYHLAATLEYRSYDQAYAEWKNIDVNFVLRLATETLAASESIYRDGLEKYSSKYVGVSANKLTMFDLPWLLRGTDWDECFSDAELLTTVHKLSDHIGLELRNSGIHIDLELRARKSSRPFCAAIQVPDEIYLVAKRSGGHRDYEEVLHELGHALHFAFTAPDVPWEFKYIIDDEVGEAYAYLIAGLLRSAKFLLDTIGLDPNRIREFIEYANFIELYMVRRYCGKVRYEAELHRRDVSASAEIYRATMEQALGFEVPGESGLLELDDGLYSFQYLTAWFLEILLRNRLIDRFGAKWWTNKGDNFLKGLWARGTGDSLASVLTSLGETAISVEPLVKSFQPTRA